MTGLHVTYPPLTLISPTSGHTRLVDDINRVYRRDLSSVAAPHAALVLRAGAHDRLRLPPVNNTKLARRFGRGPASASSGHTATSRRRTQPHVIYLAIGFPPAAKSSTYRLRATANQFAALGWDVTVINLCDAAWEREFGLDRTLLAGVDPRIRVVELPLVRQDLETDVRKFPEIRAIEPSKWRSAHNKRILASFPEPVFGGFRMALEHAVLRIHRKRPADLLMTSCAPYVNLAATWRLWEEHRVPYVVDFRDGWSIDVIGGKEAFSPDSAAARWEHRFARIYVLSSTPVLLPSTTLWSTGMADSSRYSAAPLR